MKRVYLLMPMVIVLAANCNNKQPQLTASHSLFHSVNHSVFENIREKPSKIVHFYKEFRKKEQPTLPLSISRLSDVELFAIYSAFVAYSMAPYGNSTKKEFKDLLTEDKLDCDNYALLTYYLFNEWNANKKTDSVKFKFIGWNGGVVGNHAQIFIVTHQNSILLDPTIGIAAITDFDSVASGKPLLHSQLIEFSTRFDEIKDYRLKVINALKKGLYKPSDLLYYFENFEEYKYPMIRNVHWPTPGAVSLKAQK